MTTDDRAEEEDDLRLFLVRIRDGDEDAARGLLLRYEAKVRLVVRRRLPRLLRSRFDSQDFVQSLWGSFFRRMRTSPSELEDPKSLFAVLVQAARNKVIDEYRRASSPKRDMRREEPIWEGSRPRELTDGSDAPIEWAQASEALGRLRELLPEDRRMVLDLKAAGLSTHEIAERAGLSERSVRCVIEDLRRRAGIDGMGEMTRRPRSTRARSGGRIHRRRSPTWCDDSPPTGMPTGQARPIRTFTSPTIPSGAAALLALLRVNLALRRETGEPVRVERYLGTFPDLADDVLVALLYEEFCLREEAGDGPELSEYRARFPALAGQLRELLDIHEFVGEARGWLAGREPSPPAAPFPRVGETIGEFRLVEELGRGGIARVFLAEERRLADRWVALKVSRGARASPKLWPGCSTPTSSPSTRTRSTPRRAFTCSACPSSVG